MCVCILSNSIKRMPHSSQRASAGTQLGKNERNYSHTSGILFGNVDACVCTYVWMLDGRTNVCNRIHIPANIPFAAERMRATVIIYICV